jgi:hypothetical protein
MFLIASNIHAIMQSNYKECFEAIGFPKRYMRTYLGNAIPRNSITNKIQTKRDRKKMIKYGTCLSNMPQGKG